MCPVEAKKAFDDGKISKTSYWRFKARGWVCVDYHTRTVSDGCMKESEAVFFYRLAWKKCLEYANKYAKHIELVRQVAEDLAHDIVVYLLEKKPARHIAGGMIDKRLLVETMRNKSYKKFFVANFM